MDTTERLARNLAVAIVLPTVLALTGWTSARAGALRELKGTERREARAARDSADRLSAAYQRTYGGRNPKQEGREAAFKEAETAYNEAIALYPDTEIAAYCSLRLIGLHSFARNYTKSVELTKALAKQFAGTKYEDEAYYTLGLHYLQSRHDPAAAIPWLKKVQPPPGAGPDGVVPHASYGRLDVRFVGVQQALVKCEVRLGRPAEAAALNEATARRYPYYAKSIRNHLRTEVRSALSSRALARIHPALKAWQKAHPE